LNPSFIAFDELAAAFDALLDGLEISDS